MAALIVTAASTCGGYRIFGGDQLSPEQQQLAAEMKGTIKSYLEQNISETGFGGKPFCAYKVLGIDQSNEQIHTYIYAICQEYYLKGQEATKGTGLALPIALLMQKDGTQYRIVSHEVPHDSPRYATDVERIFPRSLHQRIFAEPQNNAAILGEIDTEAKQFFQKNVSR